MVLPLNPYLPSALQDAYIPDRLIGGDKKLVTMTGVIAAGGVLYRGSVLGRNTTSSVAGAAVSGGTGNGTITGVAAGPTALPGVYHLTATSATNFTVVDPSGATRGPATVGTPYESDAIGFEINAGGTAFVVGDAFTVTVTAAAGEYLLCASAASDGSQNPVGILVDSIDTTAGALPAGIYLEGEFNANSLYFGTGNDAATVRDALAIRGIHIKFPVSGAPTVYS
jgi:hypothetical protein